MRVGFVTEAILDRPGGVERCAAAFMEAAQRAGHEVHLLATRVPDAARIREFHDADVRLASVRTPRVVLKGAAAAWQRLAMRRAFRDLARDCDFVVDVDGGLDAQLPPGFPRRRYLAYRLSFPLLPQDFAGAWYGNVLFRGVYSATVDRSRRIAPGTRVVAVSGSTRDALREKWGVETEALLYPPIPCARFAREPDARAPRIAAVGRFSPEKRFEHLVRVLAEVHKLGHREVGLEFLGGTYNPATAGRYQKATMEEARRLGVADALRFVPNVDQGTLAERLTGASFFGAAQSWPDTFSLSLLEGMAAGLVPLSEAFGGAWDEIVCRGEYGYSLRDPASAARSIVRTLEDPAERARLSAAARRHAAAFDAPLFRERAAALLE